MKAICLRGVSKTYATYRHGVDRLLEVLTRRPKHRKLLALITLDLDIDRGEVVGVIGKNGAGKSTLLKLITGTLAPTSGTITVHGQVSALLELGTGFHPEMSGRECVYMAGAVKGLSIEDIDRLYPSVVEFSGVGRFMDQAVKTYSSGMLMRLAFSVATAVEPDVLIIDEVMSVGDGAFARKSFDRIMSFKNNGATILFCSHSMYQIEAICSRVIWLDQGQVRMDGNPGQVVSEYNAFLAMGEPLPEAGDGAEQQPKSAGSPDERLAYLTNVTVSVDGKRDYELPVVSGTDDVQISVRFMSSPELAVPTVAVAFLGQDGRIVCSAGSKGEGLKLSRNPQGEGRVTAVFPRFPLLKGRYGVMVYLMCENGLHIYDQAASVAELYVTSGLERGVVKLPCHWYQNDGAAQEDERKMAMSP
ncbi:MAG: ABC transporter ATP-binding protein [Gammaproteobacteria bacterium]